VVTRCLLFLLLTCEWVGDPEQGQSLLSAPFSSQPIYCKSVYCRQNLLQQIETIRFDRLALQGNAVIPLRPVYRSYPGDAVPAQGPIRPLVYVFMAILR
jgi:hypothetical protein